MDDFIGGVFIWLSSNRWRRQTTGHRRNAPHNWPQGVVTGGPEAPDQGGAALVQDPNGRAKETLLHLPLKRCLPRCVQDQCQKRIGGFEEVRTGS